MDGLPPWVGWGVTRPLALAVLFVGVAVLVNALAPDRRRRLGTVGSLLALQVALSAVDAALAGRGFETWGWSMAATGVAGVVLAQLAAVVLFDVALPRLRLHPHRLATDLFLAAGYGLAGVVALSRHGVDLSGVLAASTVFAAVLTVSLQTTLASVLGGVAVQLEGAIRPGQWVQLENGRQGRVSEVRWRYTVLETRDGDTLLVPNAQLLTGQLTLLGLREGRAFPHRMWVWFQVAFDHPPAEVCRSVEEALRGAALENVAAEPAPDCVCMDFGRENRDGVALYAVRFWLVDPARDDGTASRVRGVVHTALRRAGIPLAEPAARRLADRPSIALPADEARRRATDTVRRLDLFEHLTPPEVEHLVERLVFVPFAQGEVLTRQGAVAHFLYIVQSGACEVRITVAGESRPVARIEGPGFFGEMGLMTGEPRHASVIALTDVACYRLDKAAFDAIIQARPAIADEVSHVLATRRAGLMAVRDGLDAEARRAREVAERAQILASVREFFGLS